MNKLGRPMKLRTRQLLSAMTVGIEYDFEAISHLFPADTPPASIYSVLYSLTNRGMVRIPRRGRYMVNEKMVSEPLPVVPKAIKMKAAPPTIPERQCAEILSLFETSGVSLLSREIKRRGKKAGYRWIESPSHFHRILRMLEEEGRIQRERKGLWTRIK